MKTHVGQLQPPYALPGIASWYAVSVLSLCAVVALTALALQDWRLAALKHAGSEPASISLPLADATQSRVASPSAEYADFTSTLPFQADPDTTLRFTSRLALDQEVRVLQMQSEAIALGANRLRQTKYTLQLRGKYRNIKNVAIGLLAKFPGLTLQRLVVHHRDAISGGPIDQWPDEASLELVQLLRPAATS